MRPRRIYADTSVIGGCLDEEFQEASLRLIGAFEGGREVLVLLGYPMLEIRTPLEVVPYEE